jgi:molybdate transport system substrate-binding protein
VRRTLLGCVAVTLLLHGCGGAGADGASDGPDLSGELTVLAAASLTESFTRLADEFEARHPGAEVRLTFDSSATLAEQVAQGAPADVLATADERTMQVARGAAATLAPPETFASNRPALVVPAGNPAEVTDLEDLDDTDVDYVVCVDSAPCGVLAAALLREHDVAAPPASEEVDVKAVLAKVAADEADAGVVYRTDVTAAGSAVTRIEVPDSPELVTAYPIVALDADEPDLALAWLDLVLSRDGQSVLREAGFGPP